MIKYTEPMPIESQRTVKTVRLAEAYVPDQPYIRLLPLDVALKKGTVFPNLVKPFPLYKKGVEK